MSDMQIVFDGKNPIVVSDFVAYSSKKYSSWEGIKSTPKLEETWKWNCLTLNYAITKPNDIIKYVISAPTGTGKTENIISYCAMLPNDINVLISTSLIDEADKIASHINFEANRKKAVAYHSESNQDISTAATYPIVVTTHQFYKKNYNGGVNWELMIKTRNLLIIDEALDTMKEISIEDTSILRAFTIFLYLSKQTRFKNNPRFMKELKYLKDDFNTLSNSPIGTNLITSNKFWNLCDENGSSVPILSLEFDKYKIFSEIVGNPNLDGESSTKLNKIGYSLKYSEILTGRNDKTLNSTIREELVNTINNLNKLKNRQVYITSNNGNKSFNRVTDDMFKKPVVIFDATAQVSEVYKLRKKYYKDLHMVKQIGNVRDYSNVNLYTTINKTGKFSINIQTASDILSSVTLGKRTLVVTHMQNESYFMKAKENLFKKSTKIVEIAHWNAITGLNNWHDFDTCIIAGLNHKPKYYAQNRTIITTDNESTAFGASQNRFNTLIEDTVIISEVIQAMNRIRIRKIINSDIDGACDKANIYLIIPKGKNLIFKKLIQQEMTNIKIKAWKLQSSIIDNYTDTHFASVISYLDGNLKIGDKIPVYDVRNKLNINADSFKSMLGSDAEKQQIVRDNINDFGYDIVGIVEKDNRGRNRKLPIKYFVKVI